MPDLADDPRFAEAGVRLQNRAELITLLEQALMKRSKHEWLPLFYKADIICGAINDYSEVTESDAFRAAALAEICLHPSAGELTLPRSPFRHPGSPRRPAPRLGENTCEVLGTPQAAD